MLRVFDNFENLGFLAQFKKKRFFFEILGVENPKFSKTEIAIL